jgi:hypothetical protein
MNFLILGSVNLFPILGKKHRLTLRNLLQERSRHLLTLRAIPIHILCIEDDLLDSLLLKLKLLKEDRQK